MTHGKQLLHLQEHTLKQAAFLCTMTSVHMKMFSGLIVKRTESQTSLKSNPVPFMRPHRLKFSRLHFRKAMLLVETEHSNNCSFFPLTLSIRGLKINSYSTFRKAMWLCAMHLYVPMTLTLVFIFILSSSGFLPLVLIPYCLYIISFNYLNGKYRNKR